jgi:hypothetical protein
MKKYAVLVILLSVAVSSCGIFPKKLMVAEAVAKKAEIESLQNPAQREFALSDLEKERISVKNAVVKDVVASNIYGYDYCVLVDVDCGDETVGCHVYSKNNKKISKLEPGVSRIGVTGDFSRFVYTLDKETQLEIVDAKIKLLD